MSATPEPIDVKPLNFRRYKDGDAKVKTWQSAIFDAGAFTQMSDLHSEHATLPGQLPRR